MWKEEEIKRIRRRTGGPGLCLQPAGGKLESPLGCSCQDSRKADIIRLITSYRLKAKQQNPGGGFPAALGQRCRVSSSELSR